MIALKAEIPCAGVLQFLSTAELHSERIHIANILIIIPQECQVYMVCCTLTSGLINPMLHNQYQQYRKDKN